MRAIRIGANPRGTRCSLFLKDFSKGLKVNMKEHTSPRPDFWDGSIWISAADAKVRDEAEDIWKGKAEAEDGTAVFAKSFTNPKPVSEAWWTMTGLGVFRAWANGAEVGADDFLKPGFTHYAKTKHSFRYDVTPLLKTAAGETNELVAAVSAGWWRDKIVRFHGRRSAFRAVLLLRHPDGSETRVCTDTTWRASGAAGPVLHAAIFDGEDYDARRAFGGRWRSPRPFPPPSKTLSSAERSCRWRGRASDCGATWRWIPSRPTSGAASRARTTRASAAWSCGSASTAPGARR